ncbi:LCP family protein [Christensenellaceae bacterium OttesenSCG-928-L17]|nr:LCP family protein [Christensenellaceae bacterium OttesenSCG-928-L17]
MTKKHTPPVQENGYPEPTNNNAASATQEEAAVFTQKTRKRKKRSRSTKRVLLGVLLIFGAAILGVVSMVAALFGRLSKPGTNVFEPEEGNDTPSVSAPIGVAEGAFLSVPPLPVLESEEEETILPLHELFAQTTLSDEQRAKMAAHNNSAKYENILLVGVDRRGTSGRANADTIMVATIDKQNNRLKLTSIMRDMYVPIPGYPAGRINSAAAKGGIPLLMQTINEAFSLDIRNYVMVDFSMFERLVNKLGGLTISMSAAEISAANDNIAGLNKQRGVEDLWSGFIFANPGNVKLTGQQALAYARIRKIDSDFSRTNRQFKVLNTIYAKFRAQTLLEQYSLLYDILPLVETDLTEFRVMELAVSALSMDTSGLLHTTFPANGLYKSGKVGTSYALLVDIPANAWAMHDFIFLSTEEPDEARVLSPGASLPPRTPAPTPGQADAPVRKTPKVFGQGTKPGAQ